MFQKDTNPHNNILSTYFNGHNVKFHCDLWHTWYHKINIKYLQYVSLSHLTSVINNITSHISIIRLYFIYYSFLISAVSQPHILTPTLPKSQFNSKQVFQLHLQNTNPIPKMFLPYIVTLYNRFDKMIIMAVQI